MNSSADEFTGSPGLRQDRKNTPHLGSPLLRPAFIGPSQVLVNLTIKVGKEPRAGRSGLGHVDFKEMR
jgi:hypothetical protein